MTDVLKRLVDEHGLANVLTGLELLCKKEVEYWTDCSPSTLNARDWSNAENAIGHVARNLASAVS